MQRKSSLGGRLLLAFVIIAGLPALAAFLGWLELQDVARNQSRVINETIPAISDVRGFAEESSRVVAVAPELAAVTTEAARQERAAFLLAQVNALRTRVARYAVSGAESSGGLTDAVADVQASILGLDLLVRQRIVALQDQRTRLQAGLAATTELLEIADTLVANAQMGASAVMSSLYGNDDRGAEARSETIDKLIEVDLFQMGLMFEFRAQTAEIGLLLNRVAAVGSQDDLARLRRDLVTRTGIVTRRILSIQDPIRAQRALVLLHAIGPAAAPPPDAADLFDVTHGILDINADIARAQEAVRVAATRLDAAAASLADQIKARAVQVGTDATAAIRVTQRLTAWGSVAALILSLVVLWVYVRGNITRRLDALSVTMTRLAQGSIGSPVRPQGHDEIAGMEGAVEIFRLQAIENRDLEAERTRNLAELHRHRNALQELVDEQTQLLRGEVLAHAKAREMAEAADRAKSEFLAMMSHEIRTPMNGVLGMLRSLARNGLTPRQHSHLLAAQASGKGLMTILNDILDYSKVEAGADKAADVTFAVTDLLREITLLMRPVAQEKWLGFRLDVPAPLPAAVRGDMGKLRQILFNLIANAIKFTDHGEVVLRAVMVDGDHQFEVRDTGKGIAVAAQDRIFRAFEQEDVHTARQFGGTGLGLAICQRFAAAMNASLRVDSVAGQGATFILRVHLAAGQMSDIELPAPTPLTARALRVLVVEDHAINQLVVQTYLEDMGHHFVTVETGEAAVQLAQEQPFDVILMDVNLPGMTGTQATRMLCDLPGGAAPVIGISAHVQETEVAAALAAGMVAVLAKPLSPEALADVLAKIVAVTQPDHVLTAALADMGQARTVRLAMMFLDRLEIEMSGIIEAVGSGDMKALARAAHQLKGAAGNFDLPAMAACLQRLDQAAEADDHVAVPQAMAAVLQVAEAARQQMTAALKRLGVLNLTQAAQ